MPPQQVYSQLNLGASLGVDSGGVNLAEQVKRLLDTRMQVRKRLLLVLERLRLNTGQTADIGLDSLGSILHLEGEGKLVLDDTSLGVGVHVDSIGLGVLLGLGENVLKGLETLGEGRNGCVVDRYSGHVCCN